MAIDGIFLHCLRDELADRLCGARIDKIHQPSREELVLWTHGKTGNDRLYLSARVNSPRVCFTEIPLENPATPPPFCMLLRKHLIGARLLDIVQPGLERVLNFRWEAVNELGDTVILTLVAEIMGRYSNLILVGEDGRVMDAIKRVDPMMSPVRPLLPGVPYQLPPEDHPRLTLQSHTAAEIADAVRHSDQPAVDKALLAATQGFSPLICREIAARCADETPPQTAQLTAVLERIGEVLTTREKRCPYAVYRADGTPLDFSYLPITQYGLQATGREYPSFSALLDAFYAEKDATARWQQRSHDIARTLNTALERLTRRMENQRRELAESDNREQKRLYGDLIHAGMAQIPAGASSAELVNYYDENCATVTVPLDPSLSAAANAQKYYKAYRKAKTAAEVLAKQIEAGEAEQRYLESVQDALSRAVNTRELEELRGELEQTGYLRVVRKQRRLPPSTGPMTFVSDDGFTVLVGRNNLQNDQLTLRTAKGSDWWFHTKNIPGSHTVVLCGGVQPPDSTLEQAAILAATYSKAAASAQVPVDYTQIRHIKKPTGARPGFVIYETNRTAYVTPDVALADRLRRKE